jgi:hypothetical protein
MLCHSSWNNGHSFVRFVHRSLLGATGDWRLAWRLWRRQPPTKQSDPTIQRAQQGSLKLTVYDLMIHTVHFEFANTRINLA